MKRIASVMIALPTLGFAHGAHAPVAETSHGLVHLAPALAVIVGALAVGWWLRRKDDV